jgi:hypothetical protein
MRRATLVLVVSLLAAVMLTGCLATPPTALSGTRVVTVFPDDRLTVADTTTATHRRLALPTAGCRQDDCTDLAAVNQLDGFDVLPRIDVEFAREPNLPALAAGGLGLRDVATNERVILERFTWEAGRLRLAAWPQQPLVSGHRYAIELGTSGRRRTLSTFTTMSATGPLQAMVGGLRDGSAWRTAHLTGPTLAVRASVPAVTSVRFLADTGAPDLADVQVLSAVSPGSVRMTAATLRDPSWMGADGRISLNSRGLPAVVGANQIATLIITPSSAAPASGWPAVVFAHGLGGSRLQLLRVAQPFLAKGYAVLAADAVGHGYGPRSQTVLVGAGGVHSVPTPGRGLDLNHDGTIERSEGFDSASASGGSLRVGMSAAVLQSAADELALVDAVRAGVDVDGDGKPDLAPTVAGVLAESAGGFYTTAARGASLQFPPTILAVTGGSLLDFQRTSYADRPALLDDLAARVPAVPVPSSNLDTAMPVVGATHISAVSSADAHVAELLTRMAWLQRPGSPDAWASVRRSRSPVLLQVARGDPTLDNRLTAELIAAGGWTSRVALWRFDLLTGRKPRSRVTVAELAGIPTLTGRHLIDAHHLLDLEAAQQQAVDFVASRGSTIVDPDGAGPIWDTKLVSLTQLTR